MNGRVSETVPSTKPLVGISSCLLGENVRYNGEIKLNSRLKSNLEKVVTFVSVCPEVESGMPVPREPMDLFVVNRAVRMVTLESGRDMTDVIKGWIETKLDQLSDANLCGFVFKERSPSCAVSSAKVHEGYSLRRNGTGLFVEAFRKRFPLLPVAEAEELETAEQKAVFLKKVYKIHLYNRR